MVDADTQGSATYWAEPGHFPMQVVHRPLEHAREMQAWSRAVRGIDADLLVLDAPPHLNEALGGVIGLSDVSLVPCGPSGLDLIATAEAVGLVRQVRDERGDGRPHILLVPNRVDRRTTSGRDLAAALKDLGEPVGPAVGARTAFSDALNAASGSGPMHPWHDVNGWRRVPMANTSVTLRFPHPPEVLSKMKPGPLPGSLAILPWCQWGYWVKLHMVCPAALRQLGSSYPAGRRQRPAPRQ